MPLLQAHPLLINTIGAVLMMTSMIGGPRMKVPGLSGAIFFSGGVLIAISAWWLYSSEPAFCGGLYMGGGCY